MLRTIYIDSKGTCSSSKEEHGSTFSHFRSYTVGITSETKQDSRGAGPASNSSIMGANSEKYIFIRDSNFGK